MSSSLSSIRHFESGCNGERDGQVEEAAQLLRNVDNSPQKMGFRSKLKRFWKQTRIPSVIKKVVERSKSLLNRLTAPVKPNATPSGPVNSGKKTVVATEIVRFPEDMISSPASSSNTASPPASIRAPSTLNTPRDTSLPNTSPTPISAPHHTVNDEVITDQEIPSTTGDENSFSKFRYKEKEYRKQKSFPEIKIGVVGSRVKWLEPLFSGEKAENEDFSPQEKGKAVDAVCTEEEKVPQALEIHTSSGLAPEMSGDKVENAPSFDESGDESVFDDSPRLYKHHYCRIPIFGKRSETKVNEPYLPCDLAFFTHLPLCSDVLFVQVPMPQSSAVHCFKCVEGSLFKEVIVFVILLQTKSPPYVEPSYRYLRRSRNHGLSRELSLEGQCGCSP